MMKSLGQRWKAFIVVVIDPWVLALLAVGLWLGALIVEQTDPRVVAILTFIISALASVLGGLLTTLFTSLTEQKVLAARGRSAVRSLHLLLRNISALHGRIRQCLASVNGTDEEEGPAAEVVAAFLEEFVGHCRVLEEETLSSIENWTDIVPEADVKTQIGLITQLRTEVDEKEKDLSQLQRQLEEARDKSAEEQNRLKGLVREKAQELEKVRVELHSSGRFFGAGALYQSPLVGSVLAPGWQPQYFATGQTLAIEPPKELRLSDVLTLKGEEDSGG